MVGQIEARNARIIQGHSAHAPGTAEIRLSLAAQSISREMLGEVLRIDGVDDATPQVEQVSPQAVEQ